MKSRRPIYDYAKGIGILAIVMAHCIQYFASMQGINGWICSFHVPIFFVVSGCIAFIQADKNENFKEFIQKKFKTLIIPYIIFSLINSALKLGVLFVTKGITNEVIEEELIALFITGNGTVWFLVTIFLVYIIHYFFKNIMKNLSLVYVVLAISCLSIPFYLKSEKPFFIVFIRVVMGFGYFCFGYLLECIYGRLKDKPVFMKNSILPRLILTLVFIFINITGYVVLGAGLSFFEGMFNNIVGSLICSLSACVGILLLCSIFECRELPKSSVSDTKENKKSLIPALEYLGYNSVIVMLVHPTILLFFTYPLGSYIDNVKGVWSVIFSLILFLIIVILEIPFIILINKKMHWLIGK